MRPCRESPTEWLQVSIVTRTLLCPGRSCASLECVPAWSNIVARVCLSPCSETESSPARWIALLDAWLIVPGSGGLPSTPVET